MAERVPEIFREALNRLCLENQKVQEFFDVADQNPASSRRTVELTENVYTGEFHSPNPLGLEKG